MPDFGVLTALQGRTDWSQVRADRMMQMQALKQQEGIFKERIAREDEARQGIQQYMDAVTTAEGLDNDVEALKAKEKQLRGEIIEGLKKKQG